ncbi:MAG: cupin domain-containing protein [Woeseiaceae bacterium]|nr:cupin domain-containing protein [Woeseiaceae bacterium]
MASKNDKTLQDEAIVELLEASVPVDPGQEAAQRMKAKLFDRLREDSSADARQFVTVAGSAGDWLETSPGNSIKILRSDDESMSMLVRLEPGTTFPAHFHPADEETYVVEGETWFGDIHLKAGDYHLAPEGTHHGEVRTDTGCVLLIRKASE